AGAQIASQQTGRFHRLLRLLVPCDDPASPGGRSLQARTIEASFVCVQLDLDAAPAVLVSLRDVHHGDDEAWFREREGVGESLRGEALVRPVAALRGYLGLLRDELPMRGRIMDLFHTLDLQSEWLQVQLESHALLEEFGRGSLWRDRPVSPWVLIERAIARVRSRLEAHGIRAVRNVPDDLPWVQVDVEKWIVDEDTSANCGQVMLQIRLERSPSARPRSDLETLGIPDREFPYGLPLARSVVHHYGGTLVCDASEGRLPSVRFSIPLHRFDSE